MWNEVIVIVVADSRGVADRVPVFNVTAVTAVTQCQTKRTAKLG